MLYDWVYGTLLMQLLDGHQPLHHLGDGGGHPVPLLHHLVQLRHLRGNGQNMIVIMEGIMYRTLVIM